MKSLFKPLLLVFVSFFALAGCSEDTSPKEGTEYTIIPTPMSDLPDVVEIFSLACGNCRNMESMIPVIEELAKVDMAKTHVTFNESAQRSAYVYYAAEIQSDGKPSEEMMAELFAYTQDGGDDHGHGGEEPKKEEPAAAMTPEQKKAQMIEIFAKYNMKSPIDLSEAEHEVVYQKMIGAEAIVTNSNIASVPAFLVKGKYLVNSSAHKTLEEMAATISYLNGLEQ
ncbi:thiol:disulfide interchange protein DsbA/DsbL [Moritella sp. 24]|uniref:thiol:disulfide interchange protein DsbA/DsbL n=1 Tax=Moritella sp. 24 TaxID=2746230 RepID=UPI001BA7600D|nr:thiol:disulfide interchange protein DsbA/DsbL [Moritella sp. 24]QUM76786.1 thiol:disulfide interchange protein DsbA/DsbL [Moritella sp. 24]